MNRPGYRCGLEAALEVLGGKWKPVILWNLVSGRRRFGELRRMVTGISEKMLIQELRELARDEIVAREDFKEIPPRVEYSLTPFGVSLSEALRPLCDWGTEHLARIEATRSDPEAVGAASPPGLSADCRIQSTRQEPA
jgi:DNA-binding HxlR family transcriptional regulator